MAGQMPSAVAGATGAALPRNPAGDRRRAAAVAVADQPEAVASTIVTDTPGDV